MNFLDDDIDEDDFVTYNEEVTEFLKSLKQRSYDGMYFDLEQVESLSEFTLSEMQLEATLEICRYWLYNMPESIDALNRQAITLLNLDRTTEALATINNALEIAPIDDSSLFVKAMIVDTSGNHKEALLIMETIIDNSPDEFEYLSVFANVLQSNNHFQRALDIYEKILDYPEIEDAPFFHEMAYCYNNLNQPEKAIEFYAKAIDEEPYEANFWYNKGVIHSALRQTKPAIECYEFAVAIEDDFFLAWYNLGFSYSDSNNFERAIRSFKEAVRIKPKDIDTLFNLSSMLSEDGQYEEAIKLLLRVEKENPNHLPALYNLGIYYDKLKQYKNAEVYLDKALKMPEIQTKSFYAKAKLYHKTGEYLKAKEEYKNALTTKNIDREILHDFVSLLFEQKDENELSDFLIGLIASFDNDEDIFPEIYLYLSAAFSLQKESDLAKEYFNTGIEATKHSVHKLSEALEKMLKEFIKLHLSIYHKN